MTKKKKKISELPLVSSLVGLYTIGVDAANRSVKVSLEWMKTAADDLTDAITDANNAATKANSKANAAQTAANNADSAAQEVRSDMSTIKEEWNTELKPEVERAISGANDAAANVQDGNDGKTTQFKIGEVTKTAPGGDPEVSLSDNGVDAQGNPKKNINISLPTGDTGPVPVVEMGTVTTVAPGGQSSATLVENGTTPEGVRKYKLNLSLVKGDTGDIENIDSVTVAFTEATVRKNINTGEAFAVLFSKIMKWFSDLKALAFKDKADWLTDIENRPTSMPASDVPAWAKAAKKPSYTASEVGASPTSHNHAGVYQPVEEGKGLSVNDYTDDEKTEVSKVKEKANKAQFQSFTLASASWADDTAESGFFTYKITDADIVANTIVELDAATDEDFAQLEEYEFSARLIVSEGQFLIRAKKQPASDINIIYAIKF